MRLGRNLGAIFHPDRGDVEIRCRRLYRADGVRIDRAADAKGGIPVDTDAGKVLGRHQF